MLRVIKILWHGDYLVVYAEYLETRCSSLRPRQSIPKKSKRFCEPNYARVSQEILGVPPASTRPSRFNRRTPPPRPRRQPRQVPRQKPPERGYRRVAASVRAATNSTISKASNHETIRLPSECERSQGEFDYCAPGKSRNQKSQGRLLTA